MIHTLAFYGSVAASSRGTIVSSRIGFPYRIKRIRVKFALGHAGLVQHMFFVSDDPVAVTSGEPSGTNILEQYGSVDYVVGDDDVMDLHDITVVDRLPTWLKILAINGDASYTHTINVIMEIDDLRKHPAEDNLRKLLGELFEETSKELTPKSP